MRPRSRLLAKRGLPTIREGFEELVQDLNQANSQHTLPCTQLQVLSTQDYFLSICQLARPTFPLHESDCDILSISPLDFPKPCLRLHRLRESARPLTPAAGAHRQPEPEPAERERARWAERASVGPEWSSAREGPSASDPLEFLYSHRGAMASSRRGRGLALRPPHSDSLARPRSSPDTQHRSSCPELCLPAPKPGPALTQRSLASKEKPDDRSSPAPSGAQCGLDAAPAGWRGKGGRCADKHTMVSHWIAECRSTWREARIRACMLPAIAEK